MRVFPFLASISGGSRFPSVSKDKGVERRQVRIGYEVPSSEQNQLENWNTPEDLSFQA
jgi:hypothetical protein